MKKHSEELFQIGEVTKIIGITRKATERINTNTIA